MSDSVKIFTNINCKSLEHLARHTFAISWKDYLSRSGENAQLVAADIFQTDDHKLVAAPKVIFRDRYFKLLACGVIHRNIKDIYMSSRGLDQLKDGLRPMIDGYRRMIRFEKPNVVLINCTYHIPWCLFVAAKEEGIKKIVIHYHGILKKEAEYFENEVRRVLLEMERDFHCGGDMVIFPSLFAKRVVEKEVVNRELKKWVVVPNPIPDYFFNCSQKKKGLGKNIGAVSRWSSIKNLEFLEKLAMCVVENKKGYRINLVSRPICSDDGLYLRMKDNVNFIDFLSNRDLAKFYSRMDLVVCPSHFETYGNVAQEALASGTPALVGSNMGISDFYRELGLDGWVVDFNDFDSAVAKIERASFEVVDNALRNELRSRLKTEKIFSRLFDLVTD